MPDYTASKGRKLEDIKLQSKKKPAVILRYSSWTRVKELENPRNPFQISVHRA
jgi:hypothetical protein